MSVGAARLREEPDRIRQGALDKGEDPATVDAALAADARRRELQGEGDVLRAERNTVSKQIGDAVKAGAAPAGPEVAAHRSRSSEIGERLTALDVELAEVEAGLEDLLVRIPNPADPDVPVGGEEANVTVRTWGELLPREQPVVGEIGADAPPGGATWRGSRTGILPKGSVSSTWPAARRSPAPGSPSIAGSERRSSGR
jgi:seryl-tRNA synthetase